MHTLLSILGGVVIGGLAVFLFIDWLFFGWRR